MSWMHTLVTKAPLQKHAKYWKAEKILRPMNFLTCLDNFWSLLEIRTSGTAWGLYPSQDPAKMAPALNLVPLATTTSQILHHMSPFPNPCFSPSLTHYTPFVVSSADLSCTSSRLKNVTSVFTRARHCCSSTCCTRQTESAVKSVNI